MSTNSLHKLFSGLITVAAISAAPLFVSPRLHAQSVPLPFAGLLAGGGTVCAASLPVFAVTGTGAKYGDGCPATQGYLQHAGSARHR